MISRWCTDELRHHLRLWRDCWPRLASVSLLGFAQKDLRRGAKRPLFYCSLAAVAEDSPMRRELKFKVLAEDGENDLKRGTLIGAPTAWVECWLPHSQRFSVRHLPPCVDSPLGIPGCQIGPSEARVCACHIWTNWPVPYPAQSATAKVERSFVSRSGRPYTVDGAATGIPKGVFCLG